MATEGRLKPSASFGSPVHSEALAPDTLSHQRSKTEHDLKSLSGLLEVMEIPKDPGPHKARGLFIKEKKTKLPCLEGFYRLMVCTNVDCSSVYNSQDMRAT